jgi:dihydroflavonol-4-reductase
VRMRELAETVVRVAGRGRVPFSLPPRTARALSGVGELVSRRIGRPPLLPTGQLHFLMWNAAPDSSKAQDELGWEPTALDDGVRRTLEAMGLA